MKLSDFEVKEIGDYQVRFVTKDGERMYFVTDLLKQYNHIHGTNKQLKQYLGLKGTRELLDVYRKMSNETESDDKHLNIKGVIEYINFSEGVNITSFNGYLMNDVLLRNCLTWIDIEFRVTILMGLDKENQDMKNNNSTNYPNDESTDTTNSITVNDDDQELTSNDYRTWSFMIIPVIKGNDVLLNTRYCLTRNITKQQMTNTQIFMIHGLPNGYSFNYLSYLYLKPVVKFYHGHVKGYDRNSYSIPKRVYEDQYSLLRLDIINAIEKTRIMLCWRVDESCEDYDNMLRILKTKNVKLCTNINMSADSYTLVKKLFREELMN